MISLLIPTINRPDFIIKYLNFLELQDFKGEVLIGDSSSKEHFQKTSDFINTNKFNFSVNHQSYPNLMHFEVIRNLLGLIKYEFCMYICDDDFLINSTLLKCVNFLKKNSQYTSVGGKALILKLNYACNEVLNISEYPLTSLEHHSPLDRFRALANNYQVVAYSLSRTEDFIRRWPESENFYEKGIVIETHPCFSASSQGKIKILDDLFVLRTNHERRILLPDFEETLKGRFWESSVEYSVNELTSIISDQKVNSSLNINKECNKIWKEYIEKCAEAFKVKSSQTSSSRVVYTYIKLWILFLIRFVIKDFRKEKIQNILIRKNELDIYESFVEVLSISYNSKS